MPPKTLTATPIVAVAGRYPGPTNYPGATAYPGGGSNKNLTATAA